MKYSVVGSTPSFQRMWKGFNNTLNIDILVFLLFPNVDTESERNQVSLCSVLLYRHFLDILVDWSCKLKIHVLISMSAFKLTSCVFICY